MPLRLRRLRKTEAQQREIAELFHKGYAADSIAEEKDCHTSFVYICARKYPDIESKHDAVLAETVLDELPAEAPFIAEAIQEKVKPVAKVVSDKPKKARGFYKGMKSHNTVPDDKRAEIVKLKTTTALTEQEIAAQVGVSDNTVWRTWKQARRDNPSLTKYRKGTQSKLKLIKIPSEKLPTEPEITDRIKAEVLKHHKDHYYSASTIAAEVGIDIGEVVRIIQEDKLNQ